MSPAFLSIAAGITVLTGFCLVIALFFSAPSPQTQRITQAVTSERIDRRQNIPREALTGSVLKAAADLRSLFGFKANGKLKDRLVAAGLRDPAIGDLFFAAQCLTPLLGAFAGSFMPVNPTFWVMSLGAIGYITPDFLLTGMINRRKKRILRSIPDAVDLLVICVDAGLGLDQALLRVGEELAVSHPDIHGEFLRVQLEQRAGSPRLIAWQGLANRTQIPEFASFVSMLTQTDRFGTPIVKALSRFADDLRLKRRQKVEEMAAKTKIKIIFPLVFFVFPSLFIVLLAPALLGIITELKGIN
jgi:tight adherence protein C